MPIETHDLAAAQRQQMIHRGSPGQRLANRFKQGEILRTRQDPAAGPWIRVDEDLQVGKEVRDALHFVDDGPFGKLAQEASRVLRGESAYIRSFERRVRMLRKYGCA